MKYIKFNEYVKLHEMAPMMGQTGQALDKIIRGVKSGEISGDIATKELDKIKANKAANDATMEKNKLLTTQSGQNPNVMQMKRKMKKK